MLVTSRSGAEYAAMFDLDLPSLRGRRVLDCSAGASSFVVNARAAGVLAVAVDPAYAAPRAEIAATAAASNAQGSGIAREHSDRFTWQWYGGAPEARDRMRTRALAEFTLDLARRPSAYVAGALPTLPFRDAAFDLALCSHLLFTWADELGAAWHVAGLRELVRVAREVRVFPTVVQKRGEPVPFWDEVIAALSAARIRCDRRRVPYEFQIGGDTMLVLAAPDA